MSTGSIRHSQHNVPSVRTAAADIRVHGGWSVWGGRMGTRYVNCCTLVAVLDVCHIVTILSHLILSHPILYYPIQYTTLSILSHSILSSILPHPILASRLVMEAFKHVPIPLQKPLWRLRVSIMSKQGKNVLGECWVVVVACIIWRACVCFDKRYATLHLNSYI